MRIKPLLNRLHFSDKIKTMSTPPPNFIDQCCAVANLLKKGIKNGVLIGLVCFGVALLDQKGTFTEFIADNMTNMPLTVILAGVVGGFGFILQTDKNGFLASAGKAWLDLIQQFFSLGLGAFWFIQAAVWIRHKFMGATVQFDFAQAIALFSGLVVMAFITTALDVAGSETMTPMKRLFGTIECVIAVLLLIGLLRFFDGEAIKCDAGGVISRWITGNAKACDNWVLPTVYRSTERTSDNRNHPKTHNGQ